MRSCCQGNWSIVAPPLAWQTGSISTMRRSRPCAGSPLLATCRSDLTHERRCSMSGTFHVHHLDPMPASEVEFAQSLLPGAGFTTTAPGPDATSPATDLL